MDCSLPGSSVYGTIPGKNPAVGCHFLLQRIVPTQGWNLHLLHWQVDSLPLSHQGSAEKLKKKKIIWIDRETFCIKFLFYVCVLGCVWLFVIPWCVAFQALLSMGFFRQEYWSRLSFPPPGDIPDLGIKPMYLMSPALAGRFITTVTPGKPSFSIENGNYFKLVYLSQSEILLWFMIRVLKSWLSCEHEILNIQYVSEISWIELKAEQM